MPEGSDFVKIRIPFASFSDRWSPYTGELTATCQQDKSTCITASVLKGIKRLEVWAEGVDGKAHLEVKAIYAVVATEDAPMAAQVSAVPPVAALTATTAAKVELATFDGSPATTFKFQELNDPVMGGKSNGTWHIDASGFGVFDGEVVDVPSLKAPGFITAAANGHFPDASAAAGGALVLQVRSSTPGYKGFRASFASGTLSPAYACSGGGSIPLSRGCYKAKFSVSPGADFQEVRIPFADFSDRWSPATGELTASCSQDPSTCVTAKVLKGISRMQVWAEGVGGKAHLEVKAIYAVASGEATPGSGGRVPGSGSGGATPMSGSTQPPAAYNGCRGPVQDNLRFGISGRTTPEVPVPVDENETLAEAICCDVRTKVYAEPQFLYQAPDITLYSKLDQGVTTFYDSVCGLPLFRAPVNRSLDDFKADTDEHGWPSFRSEEVVNDNVRTDKDGFVYSACGTHLGSYLPDAKGPRWCMDLSCIAGNQASAGTEDIIFA